MQLLHFAPKFIRSTPPGEAEVATDRTLDRTMTDVEAWKGKKERARANVADDDLGQSRQKSESIALDGTAKKTAAGQKCELSLSLRGRPPEEVQRTMRVP